ncbi:MAG: T9SS type A sorting domain-containing protein, partial [Bacteroidia bacterium]
PMGGQSFTQAYTNQIRKFTLVNTTDTFYISSYVAVTDSINLHRRDYNFTPNIDVNGKEWYTVWTGVFQYNQDLPWLNTVDVGANGHQVNNGFNQYLSQYHSANIPIFDSSNQNMYTIFLGGISQFYANENGQIVQNDSVPFVKTISYVKRDVNGNLSEHRFTTEMPGFIGAGAEFIPSDELTSYHNEVLKLNSNNSDSILVGYVVGGINSSQRNIFWINTGTQSTANNTVYQVWLVKSNNTSTLKIDDAHVWDVDVYPNPAHKQVSIKLPESNKNRQIKVSLNSLTGQLIKQLYDDKYNATIHLELPEVAKGTYYLTIQRGQLLHVEKLIIE